MASFTTPPTPVWPSPSHARIATYFSLAPSALDTVHQVWLDRSSMDILECFPHALLRLGAVPTAQVGLPVGALVGQVGRLTFHLLLAKFFLICSLTDWWMFLSRAVSPAILGQEWGRVAGEGRGEPRDSNPQPVGVLTTGAARPAHR